MLKHLTLFGLAALSTAVLFSAAIFSHAAAKPGPSGYHVIKTVSVPGDEGWDYIYVDSDARRVYISHSSHTVVMNADTTPSKATFPTHKASMASPSLPTSVAASPVTAAPTPPPFSI